MLDTLQALVAPAALQRLTLVLNHVLASEPVASARLKNHAGRCIGLQLQGWPSLLPPPPPMFFCVTRAGLLEWQDSPGPVEPDLRVDVDASNPLGLALKVLTGGRPSVAIQGDAGFASDVNWLADNLRWDVAADLDRLFGPVAARQLAQAGRAFSAALKQLVQAGGAIASRTAADPFGRPMR